MSTPAIDGVLDDKTGALGAEDAPEVETIMVDFEVDVDETALTMGVLNNDEGLEDSVFCVVDIAAGCWRDDEDADVDSEVCRAFVACGKE